jgi:phage repressor protein C with HTH and peptisase S24 domain
MGFHAPYVRSQRTSVNGENVRTLSDKADMPKETVGQKLIALRARSGLSMEKVAKAMGLKGRSSVQRLFVEHLDDLTPADAFGLANAFDGKGDPPIAREEVLNLSKYPLAEVRPNETQRLGEGQLRRDVPVYGTAMGTYKTGGEGPEVEQAFIDYSDTIDYFTRPPRYSTSNSLYGLYVTGPSMEPKWASGDPLYVDSKRPPAIGDDVVVYLVRPSGSTEELEAVLIKRLVKQSPSFVELEQFNPPTTFRIDRKRIKAVHRVVPLRELLS